MTSTKKHSRDWDHDEEDYKSRKEKKKAEKKVEKVAKLLGYSNEINPFGDTNLLKPFVWGKKDEIDKQENKKKKKDKKKKESNKKKSKRHRGSDDSSSDDSSEEEEEQEDDKRLKLLQEIEKVRQRRENREKELAEMERLRDEEQRLRELASFSNWQEKEEEFHLEQIKERTKLRLLTNRCHLIDRLITNIILIEAAKQLVKIFQNNYQREIDELLNPKLLSSNSNNNHPNVKLLQLLLLPIESQSPVDILIDDFRYLTVQEIEEVIEDIQQLQQLDERKENLHYRELWISLIAVLQSLQVKKKREKQPQQQQYLLTDAMTTTTTNILNTRENRDLTAFHQSIQSDVNDFLKNKSMKELKDLEKEIQQNLSSALSSKTPTAIDFDYWEYMLQEIQFQKHKIIIQEIHATILQELLQLIETLNEYGILQERQKQQQQQQQQQSHQSSERVYLYREKEGNASQAGPPIVAGKLVNPSSSSTFPVVQDHAIDAYLRDMEKDAVVADAEEESDETKMLASDEIFLPVPQDQYHWQDKYRPRKPRYFNRVKTGWDRNKYNLTHYDPDNPPPKMIQGYKFTIFYPDLIDKTVTPQYSLAPCPDSISHDPDHPQEFVMIRFHAGPPYEDIAFKIINKQWDTHKRSGFISTFDRGILQLHFNFKRSFYRR